MSAEEDIRKTIAGFALPHGQDGDQGRGWVTDRIKQTVLWNEGDPNIHSEAKR